MNIYNEKNNLRNIKHDNVIKILLKLWELVNPNAKIKIYVMSTKIYIFIAREMDAVAKRKCFGEEYTIDILGVLTFQEAKAKYEAWKKQKDETFDTGDEVYDKEIASKGVILRRYNSDTLDILWDDGSAGETIAIKAITKTGRHFPEVAELLEKMRGDSDDKD